MSKRLKAFLVLASLIIMYVVIGLWANDYFGTNKFESSDFALKPLINPPPLTFAIWSIIYLGITAFSIYQILPSNIDSEKIDKIRLPVMINFLANAFWLVFSSYLMLGVALGIMVVLLGTLVAINNSLRLDKPSPYASYLLFVNIPFSLYFGWVLLASVLNVTSVLYIYEWSGWGITEQTWTILVMIVAFLITTYIYIKHGSIFFQMVIVWAFSNLAMRHLQDYPTIAYLAIILAVISVGNILFGLITKKKQII